MRTVLMISVAAAMLASGASAQTSTAGAAPAKKPGMFAKMMAKAKAAKAQNDAAASSAAAPAPATVTHATTTSTKTAAVTGGRKPRTPESLACSQQADSKGLHGAERKKFRASCMKG